MANTEFQDPSSSFRVSAAWARRDYVFLVAVGVALLVLVVLGPRMAEGWGYGLGTVGLCAGVVAWLVHVSITRDQALSAKHESFARRLRDGTAMLVKGSYPERLAAAAELWILAAESEIHRPAIQNVFDAVGADMNGLPQDWEGRLPGKLAAIHKVGTAVDFQAWRIRKEPGRPVP